MHLRDAHEKTASAVRQQAVFSPQTMRNRMRLQGESCGVIVRHTESIGNNRGRVTDLRHVNHMLEAFEHLPVKLRRVI
jgi:hypothetical protein